MRVLVVDDDDDSRDLVVNILEKCQAITFPASSAEQALSLMLSERPDVIVSDIGMPGMDGYDLMRAVRALPDEHAAASAGSRRHCLCPRIPRIGNALWPRASNYTWQNPSNQRLLPAL